MRPLVFFVMTIFLVVTSRGQELIVYPVPEGVPRNEDFTVNVRSAGGQWKESAAFYIVRGDIPA
jgi:hypothetical protein